MKKRIGLFLVCVLLLSAFGTASVGIAETPATLKWFAQWSPSDMSAADAAWVAAIEEAVGVKLEFEIPPSANYEERLQLMLSSGDMADIILFNGTADKKYVDAVNGDLIANIAEYVQNSPNIVNYSYQSSFDALDILGDGGLYGVPRTTIRRADGFDVRKDWLDAVGFEIPEDNLLTLEQFKEMLYKITYEDPDGNGQNDTYGLGVYAGGNGDFGLFVDYPFGLLGWQKVDEEYEYMDLKYSKQNPAYKNALQYNADLVKEGLVDPNFASIKNDAAKARFKQGITGVRFEFAGWIAEFQLDAEALNPKAEMTYINGIKNDDGVFQRPSFGTGLWGLWAIAESCENKEAAVAVFDWLLGDDGWAVTKYGVEGVTYNVVDGEKVATDEFSNFTWGPASMRRNNDPEFFTKINMPAQFREPVMEWIDTAIKAEIPSVDFGYRPPAADEPAYIDYDKQMAQALAQIIIGARPVSDWDNVLDGWYAAGGDKYMEQMNEYIRSKVK